MKDSSTQINEASTNESTDLRWVQVADLLNANPDDLVYHSSSLPQQQWAKDTQYAKAIQDAWKEEISQRDSTIAVPVEWSKILYSAIDDDDRQNSAPLYGYVLQCHHDLQNLKTSLEETSSEETASTPPDTGISTLAAAAGIILFHTGAGPHDIFLLWKAESLLYELRHVVRYVFIADILSDETGWAWNPDRTRYDQTRANLFIVKEEEHRDSSCHRPILQRRVLAAMDALCRLPQLDCTRIGAMGWCLGGHAIWELGLLGTPPPSQHFKVRCMATFHGVCDGDWCDDAKHATDCHDESNKNVQCSILVCNGSQDPFVPLSDLMRCIDKLRRQQGQEVRLLEFPDAKHGFSNPAQHFNDLPAFDFHQESAQEAWRQAIALFRERLQHSG